MITQLGRLHPQRLSVIAEVEAQIAAVALYVDWDWARAERESWDFLRGEPRFQAVLRGIKFP